MQKDNRFRDSTFEFDCVFDTLKEEEQDAINRKKEEADFDSSIERLKEEDDIFDFLQNDNVFEFDSVFSMVEEEVDPDG